jgi:hypothetical protein
VKPSSLAIKLKVPPKTFHGVILVKTNERLVRKKSGGRPRKFAEPSRPITLTLPERTLRELRHVSADPGQAIVKLASWALQNGGTQKPLVEIVKTSADLGIIVTAPSRALSQISFLHLVEVAPARYLLALDSGHDFKSLEIAISDILDDVPQSDKRERELMAQLRQHIKRLRKSGSMKRAEILFAKSS